MYKEMRNQTLIIADLHEHEHKQNRFAVIPTAEKLNAKKEWTGKGVTIAFLDSGFYPHPDYADRVIAFTDISGEENSFGENAGPNGYHWHGTQTIVSCAGNGKLSDGVYSGLASNSELVLVKVSENGGSIPDKNIEKGLQWVLENHKNLGIRVVNMSLGGDRDLVTDESKINQLAEQLIQEGICITVAAGNSAETRSIPPASSPSVITVGGYSDENRFVSEGFNLYHSSFGKTADGLIKPEIIAPAMFVAAPILPNTPLYQSSELLSELASNPDYCFQKLLHKSWEKAELPESLLSAETETVRQHIEEKLREQKIIATHYQHVDGTSFAAPIVASVIAQMLEANPKLTPAIIKNILISTASRLAGFPTIRQGYGILNAGLAVESALNETHFLNHENFGPPFIKGRKIIFTHHDDAAESVFLVGDFNAWKQDEIEFKENADGIWQAEIPCQPSGKYAYKFLINGEHWTEDPNHGLKEDDGFGGFNSILQIV
jgi:serine protease AprX